MGAPDPILIEHWLEGVRRGDERAAEALLEYYRPLIQHYLCARIRLEEDCLEMTQEVLLRVARALPRFAPHAPFEHWLMRVLSNSLKRYYTQYARPCEIPLSSLPAPDELPALQTNPCANLVRQIALHQTQQRLREIVTLVCSPTEQQVIRLLEANESIGTVARMLQMNENTARSHLMRGRAKVLAHIVQYEPSLVGGTEAIERAVEQLQQRGAPHEQLTPLEHESLRHPRRNQRDLRRACLKVAPYLWRSIASS